MDCMTPAHFMWNYIFLQPVTQGKIKTIKYPPQEKCDTTTDLWQKSETSAHFVQSHCAFVTVTYNMGSLFDCDLIFLAL